MPVQSPKIINLALQGGGSHGAFTWGVLDRLLEENDRLKIEGISGTSAGALNAAVLMDGYHKNGAAGARQHLDAFWQSIGDIGRFGLPQRTIVQQMLGNWNTDQSPSAMMMNMWQNMFSPYQINPFNFNPLRDGLNKTLDIKSMHACKGVKLFVSTTNVETGRIRIFTGDEITLDALMASACLPFTFQAVVIDGHPYWDGGYVGNPAVFPLIYNCESRDVLIVQVNPLIRPGIPDSAGEIINRLNEISFNSALMGEMRAIAFVQDLIEEDELKGERSLRMKMMNIHAVGAENEMRNIGSASKMNIDMDFLLYLKGVGRKATDNWLKENWDAIGERSSVDVKATFL